MSSGAMILENKGISNFISDVGLEIQWAPVWRQMGDVGTRVLEILVKRHEEE